MKRCPFCTEEIPEDSKVCKFCSSAVVKKCPFCAEDLVATARLCRFCKSDLAGGTAPPAPARAPRLSSAPLGEERGILAVILLTFLTCGIYGLVVLYKIGGELNAHQGRSQLRPGLDILLSFVTCGFWGVWVMYKYPSVLQEIAAEEQLPQVELTVPCLILSIFGLQIVALAILQSELNKHWETHRRGGA